MFTKIGAGMLVISYMLYVGGGILVNNGGVLSGSGIIGGNVNINGGIFVLGNNVSGQVVFELGMFGLVLLVGVVCFFLWWN